MQRYNTPNPIWHLLSFSIRKIGKNKRVNNRYSTSYKRKNIFENFPVVRANGTHLTGTDARRVRPHQAPYPLRNIPKQNTHMHFGDARTISTYQASEQVQEKRQLNQEKRQQSQQRKSTYLVRIKIPDSGKVKTIQKRVNLFQEKTFQALQITDYSFLF